MKTLQEINLNSTEEEIIKFCQEIPELNYFGTEIKQMYLNYGQSLLTIKQQQKLLNDQNNFNAKILKTNKRLVTATWALVIVTLLIVLIKS